ncbi:MAG: alpha/beta hydrolase [Terracidiphilus sp.]
MSRHFRAQPYRILVFAVAAGFSVSLSAQQPTWQPAAGNLTLPLWPGAPPGARPNPPAEFGTFTEKNSWIAGRPVLIESNVSTPTITIYSPRSDDSAAKNSQAAIVVFPGGGYNILAIDLEGTEVCRWLNSMGVACVLLKYRVPNSGPYPKFAAALQDAQRAVGMVRYHSPEWHIDPNRVGVLGFSAGGHLAAAISNHFEQRLYDPVDVADDLSCRPDFAVLVYPAYLTIEDHDFAPNPELHPTANTPRTFIVQTENDPVHVENALVYYRELKNAKVPAELHIYAQGGHGYGLRPTALPVTTWPASVETWLRTTKVLPPK